ncbi:hypothetical protein [Mucilaginibacter aquatilis]|uniref:Uncharacterized protein n=1 Tax=Mucilaginibacter aquatilis TaxID=1517760 RepID=A0A6I4IR43_9SPHI|nr:hypothetical protein [Mucilaginibacter aquatilis]MVN92893.1 hypothetical protein [Mucilaginibacter aquatilis]
MKTLKFLAKFITRLVFILLLFVGYLLIQNQSKLHNAGYIKLQWQLIFPLVLILSFIGLFITAAVKKFNQGDLNLLLIVNSVMLIIYGMAIFFRIYAMIGHV